MTGGEWDFSTLKTYVDSLIEANDRRYEQRFGDSQTAIAAALAGVKLGGDAALVAQKEAAAKAEEASERRFEAQRTETNQRMDELSRQISDLKQALSGLGGRSVGIKEMWGYIIAAVTVLIAWLLRKQ
jgi:vacuolar-type H+-ATPase subunit I/STV1